MPSPYSLILADVNTLAGQISTWSTSSTRKIRKQVVKNPGEELPLLIIVPFMQVMASESFEDGVQKDYTVGLAVLYESNRAFESGLSSIIDAIYDLEKKLNVSGTNCLPTASTVRNVDIDLNPDARLFDLAALQKNIEIGRAHV